MRIVVAGAGMAGLVAAARATELGASVVVLERAEAPGGSLVHSSGVVWRHRRFEALREECPAGDESLQRLVWERLDEALAWLEAAGAPVVERGTGNRRTTGLRFDPAGLVAALAGRLDDLRTGEPLRGTSLPLVLATGGFGALVARRRRLPLRAGPCSDGAGIELGRSRGGALAGLPDELYAGALPATPRRLPPGDWVRAAQLYGRHAVVVALDGSVLRLRPAWHESDLAQAIARLPRGQAWLVVDAEALRRRVRERTVADLVATAEEVGGEVRRAPTLAALELGEGVAAAAGARLAEPPFTAVRVVAAVTQTLAGLRVDTRARVLREDGSAVRRLWAAGADAGGIYTGGYGSGLAAALVLGLVAAEDVLAAAAG